MFLIITDVSNNEPYFCSFFPFLQFIFYFIGMSTQREKREIARLQKEQEAQIVDRNVAQKMCEMIQYLIKCVLFLDKGEFFEELGELFWKCGGCGPEFQYRDSCNFPNIYDTYKYVQEGNGFIFYTHDGCDGFCEYMCYCNSRSGWKFYFQDDELYVADVISYGVDRFDDRKIDEYEPFQIKKRYKQEKESFRVNVHDVLCQLDSESFKSFLEWCTVSKFDVLAHLKSNGRKFREKL